MAKISFRGAVKEDDPSLTVVSSSRKVHMVALSSLSESAAMAALKRDFPHYKGFVIFDVEKA